MHSFTRPVKIGLFGLALGLGLTLSAPAQASKTVESIKRYQNTCQEATRAVERKQGIPMQMLHAISLTESGRWLPSKRGNIAWPWTVTSGGKGTYYNSREEALAAVRALQDKGVTNIDVGCMQVNLYYHGENFASLEAAFDPVTNATYASEFLMRLKRRHNTWSKAVGFYHSGTKHLHDRYKKKVLTTWREIRREYAEDRLAQLREKRAEIMEQRRKGRLEVAQVNSPSGEPTVTE